MEELTKQLVYLGQLFLAVLLGGIVGLERELANKPAGLRTHMLVAGASAMFVIMGLAGTRYFEYAFEESIVMSDPVRIIQAIAVGISFIGAGTIIQVERKGRVKHLTTAASILFTAALAIGVVFEMYLFAFIAAILAVFINRSVQVFEDKYLSKRHNIDMSDREKE